MCGDGAFECAREEGDEDRFERVFLEVDLFGGCMFFFCERRRIR